MMKDINGEFSRVYVKHVSSILNYRLMTINDYEDTCVVSFDGIDKSDD